MRLTEKVDEKHYWQLRYGDSNICDILNKLGQLEDIEEELGIDLLILFKTLKNGAYMGTKHFNIVYCKCPKLVHYKRGWKILIYGAALSLTTYGKTWALTKEELL